MNRFTNHYLELPSHFYRHIEPEPLVDARLIHDNQTLAESLNIQLDNSQILQITAGQALAPGMEPIAQKYTGHQFGYYNPDLGDGRGLLLGQAIDAENQSWDLHLKGAGMTPYSRRGDGRAVLRSAVREYLIGEALHHLEIPTTRCLSLCHSPEPVRREKLEDRASYIRVAKTHVRFGHFEWLAQQGNKADFEKLANYVIEVVYPQLIDETPQTRFAELFRTVCIRTAELIAKWQAAGFCHGVMNSDNMSIAGETFDFGPYAFLDDFKIHHICNHSDTEGRYAYSQQPNIGLWNCQVLGQAFSILLSTEQIEQGLDAYVTHYNQAYLNAMGSKFGIDNLKEDDKHFIADSLILMDQSDIDFHHFFHHLAMLESRQEAQWFEFVGDNKAWHNWRQKYLQRTSGTEREKRQQKISAQTAQFILRNHIAQEIIESCELGDYELLGSAMRWLQTPCSPPEELKQSYAHFLEAPNEESKGLALSCSS